MSFFSTEANQPQLRYFSPGWNDPPAIAVSTGFPAAPSQLSSQRKRRPLDPSVQQDLGQNFGNGGGVYGAQYGSSQQATPGSPTYQQHYQQPVMLQQPQHHQQQYHQPNQHNYQASMVNMRDQQSLPPQMNLSNAPSFVAPAGYPTAPQPHQFSTHPASAFTPMVPTNVTASLNYPDIYTEVCTGRPSTLNSQPQHQYAIPVPQQQQLSASGNPHASQIGGFVNQPYQAPIQDSGTRRDVPLNPPTSQHNNQQQQMRNYEENNLIFSPPNTVNFDNQQRPATQPDPTTYIAPTKAAGDVSLSGPQLVSFLIKATIRLSQGPMREGIQLKIGQLNDLVVAGQLSESCLKKLNFVVDAVDRGAYDEAWQFFEQLQINFPDEISNGAKWTQGLKFLILELKKQKYGGGAQLHQNENQRQIRAESAGTRMM